MNSVYFASFILALLFFGCDVEGHQNHKPITCDCPLDPIYDTIIISNEGVNFRSDKKKISGKAKPTFIIPWAKINISVNLKKITESADGNKSVKYTVVTNKLGDDFSARYGMISKLFCDRYKILCTSNKLNDTSINKLYQDFIDGFTKLIQAEFQLKSKPLNSNKIYPKSIVKPIDPYTTIYILGDSALLDGAKIQFTDHSPLFEISSDHTIRLSNSQIKQLHSKYDQNMPVKIILKNNTIEILDYLGMAPSFPYLPTTIKIQ